MKKIGIFALLFVCGTAVQAQQASNTAEKLFTVKLTEEVPMPPHCGVIASAVVHKYEVITSSDKAYVDKYVLIANNCPEMLGKDFFKKGKTYTVKVTTTGLQGTYNLQNKYKGEELPVYWSTKMF